MGFLSDFSEILGISAKRAGRFWVLLPVILAYGLPQSYGYGIAARVTEIMRTDPDWVSHLSQQYGTVDTGWVPVLMLFVLILAPAIVSGVASQAGSLAQYGDADMSTFFDRMGKYYWRVVGAYLLFSLVSAAVTAPFGGFSTGSWGIGGESSMSGILGLVLSYFFTPWIAAVVIDGSKATDALGSGARFAWKNAALFLPAYLLYMVVGRILSGVQMAVLTPAGSVNGLQSLFSVDASQAVFGIITGSVTGYLYMVFLVFTMMAYARTMQLRPLPEVPSGSGEFENHEEFGKQEGPEKNDDEPDEDSPPVLES